MCLALAGESQLKTTAEWLALAHRAGSRQRVSEGTLGQAVKLRFGNHLPWVFLKGQIHGEHHSEWLG